MAISYIYLNLRTKRWQIGDKPKSSAAFPQVRALTLRGVTFKVNEGSRQYCVTHRLKSGKPYKFVHAWAIGEVIERGHTTLCGPGVAISYHPDKGGSFYRRDTGAAVSYCERVAFNADGSAIAYGEVH